MTNDSIRRKLREYPSAGLSVGPTPIYALQRLSARLGHHIYVLREDLTGFALGGNKVRKLDYLVGDAIARGVDVLVTTGASAFSRNAAAAGKVCGLGVHVLVVGRESEQNRASLALFEQFDCTLHFVHESEALEEARRGLMEELRGRGAVACELHPGGSNEIGALGYLEVFDHIVQYSEREGVHFDKVFIPTGSTGTQVGLIMGQMISQYETRVIGIAVSKDADTQRERIGKLARTTADMLGLSFDETKLIVDDRFLGPGYPHPSEAGDAAMRTFGQVEGLLLDRVYTGKAAAGLLHYATTGELDPEDKVLFIHTGGNSGLYY